MNEMDMQVLRAVSVCDYARAWAELDRMRAQGASPWRTALLAAIVKAHLAPVNCPEAYQELMDVARAGMADGETRLMALVEASYIAFRLNDPIRIAQVVRVAHPMARKAPSPNAGWLRGLITLNEANLARQLGSGTALALYGKAAAALRAGPAQYICQLLAALARLSVQYEYVGQHAAADAALAEAEACAIGPSNRQELRLAKAEISRCRGQWAEARVKAEEAVAIAAVAKDMYVVIEARICMAEIYTACGQPGEAAACCRSARELALRHRYYHLLHHALLRSIQNAG
jgi:tetratricopeptide (TPR) repeat protein